MDAKKQTIDQSHTVEQHHERDSAAQRTTQKQKGSRKQRQESSILDMSIRESESDWSDQSTDSGSSFSPLSFAGLRYRAQQRKPIVSAGAAPSERDSNRQFSTSAATAAAVDTVDAVDAAAVVVVGQRHRHHSGTPRSSLITTQRPSILSSEHAHNNYRGLINLGILILLVSHLRLLLENYLKYGILVDTFSYVRSFIDERQNIFMLFLLISYNVWIVATYLAERMAGRRAQEIIAREHKKQETAIAKGRTPPPFRWGKAHRRFELSISAFHYISLLVLFSVTVYTVLTTECHPVAGVVVMAFNIVLLLKLLSYVVENKALRRRSPDRRPVYIDSDVSGAIAGMYPANVTLSNLYLFLCMPTLVYEEQFARSARIRKKWLARRIAEFLFFAGLMIFMAEQYIRPLVVNAVPLFAERNVIGIIERLMKLTVPMIILWLLMFYVFFHLYLNILAEVTRFGDRQFYREWWNATSLGEFWRRWNIPTHRWLVKMIYLPLTNRGFSRALGAFMVFFVSALLHELVISLPFRQFKLYAFGAMMVQWPLCFITDRYTRGKTIGNLLFWASFMFGQSQALLFYYSDFVWTV